jgi:hypothetical protein
MALQLAQSTSILARARNRLASPINFLPEEVLYQIFLNVVYAPENTNSPMNKSLRAIYGSLHKLLAVCSIWRNIAISRGTLWDIIPAADIPVRSQKLGLSLDRSGGRALHLVAIATADGPPCLFKTITENNVRLRTLNVQSAYSNFITPVIAELLRGGVPDQLSELFMRCSPPKYSQPPRISNCVVEDASIEQADFNKLISSLSALRLSGIQLDWKTTNNVFSDRLVEFHIHKVGLGNSDTAMLDLLLALSSATKLRDLKIVDVRAYRISAQSSSLTPPIVVFPKLQSFLLQDVCFNVLEFFLLGIAPGSYHMTLALSDNSFRIGYSGGGMKKVSLAEVTQLITPVKVDTLSLPRGSIDDKAWLKGPDLRALLESVPKLKELKLHGWHFYEDFCDGLCPPPTSDPPFSGFPFQDLEFLQLTAVRIRDQERFRNIPVALSPRTMVFNGSIKEEGKSWVQLTEDDEVVNWLRNNVPGFRLVDAKYDAAALKIDQWRL